MSLQDANTSSQHLRHLFSVTDMGRAEIEAILERAHFFRTAGIPGSLLIGKILGLLMFQPSTRTRVGFHAAMARLGGAVIEVTETKFQQGMERAESLADSVRSISAYCDVLVVRQPSSQDVCEVIAASNVPVINGGSGCEHHPTQALIDLFAIERHFSRLSGLRIGIAGDLRNSRAARSLVQALKHFPPSELLLMSPPGRELPTDLLTGFDTTVVANRGEFFTENLDVLYMAGLPEGLGRVRLGKSVREGFRLTRSRAEKLSPDALVLDPLPRIDEIEPEVDLLPVAGYFRQSQEALYVRCGVLERVLSASA